MVYSSFSDYKMKKVSLYFILLSAFLNAVLRLSAESNITLFRLLIPYAIILIFSCSKKFFKNLIFSILFLGILSFVQHILTSYIFYKALDFNLIYFLEFFFHYSCIVLVGFLLICLKDIEKDNFEKNFITFATSFVKILAAFIFVYTIIMNKPLHTIKLADNINNVGCVFVAAIALLLTNATKRKQNFIWVILLVFLLFYNDSKAALFGACVEIAIFLMLKASQKFKVFSKVITKIFFICALFFVACLLIISPTINGYSLSGIIVEPIKRIVTNQPFPYSSTSATYRTNSTIAAFGILKNTLGMGVGFGNTSRILKLVMVNVYSNWATSIGYSLHNWWLELMCDFGWIILIPFVYAFLKQAYLFFFKTKWEPLEILKCALILSFPIWSISASGLTTEYFTLSVLFFVANIKNVSYNLQK